jgi:hypothetical protein
MNCEKRDKRNFCTIFRYGLDTARKRRPQDAGKKGRYGEPGSHAADALTCGTSESVLEAWLLA